MSRCGTIHRSMVSTPGTTPLEKADSLSQQASAVTGSSAGNRGSGASALRARWWLDWSCVGRAQAATASVVSHEHRSCRVQKILFCWYPPWLLSPLLWWLLSLSEDRYEMCPTDGWERHTCLFSVLQPYTPQQKLSDKVYGYGDMDSCFCIFLSP